MLTTSKQILLEHWRVTHEPQVLNGEGTEILLASCGPLDLSVLKRELENDDEWDSFLRYNQLVTQYHFDFRAWDSNDSTYKRRLDQWHQYAPTNQRIMDTARFRYRKRWRLNYSTTNSSDQLLLLTEAETEELSPYPDPDFDMLESRVVAMAPDLHDMMNGIKPSGWLTKAQSEGWLQTRGMEKMECGGMDACHAGYYGSLGRLFPRRVDINTSRLIQFRFFENIGDPQYARYRPAHPNWHAELFKALTIRFGPGGCDSSYNGGSVDGI